MTDDLDHDAGNPAATTGDPGVDRDEGADLGSPGDRP